MRSREEFTEMVFERGRLREEQNNRRKIMMNRAAGAAAAAVVVAVCGAVYASRDANVDLMTRPDDGVSVTLDVDATTAAEDATMAEVIVGEEAPESAEPEVTEELEVKVVPGKLNAESSGADAMAERNDDSLSFDELLAQLGYSLAEEYEGNIRIIDTEGNEHLFSTMEEVYEFLESDHEYLFKITGDLRASAGLEMQMSENSRIEEDQAD